jgi:uncharacterized protein
MGENRRAVKISDMPPGLQLLAALLCVVLVFVVAYPLMLLAGWLSGVDLQALNDAIGGTGANMWSLKYLQLAQHLSLFILPVAVWSALSGEGVAGYTGLNLVPGRDHIVLVIIIALLLIPVNSYTSYLNLQLKLPEWLSATEEWMQQKEEQGEVLTSLLIRSETIASLLMNLLVLALIPAIGEELFFRGMLQKLLKAIIGRPHLTVVITAIIFSALHFQFYGFLPRLILGIVYGYLFFWSRSVWLPALAHFLNNAVPVVLSYFYGWDTVSGTSLELAGERPLFPVVSFVALVVLLIYAAKVLRAERREET